MRVTWILAVLLALASCSGDPSALGITGPGVEQVKPATGLLPDEGASTTRTGTSTFNGTPPGPTRGPSGFWGYN